MTSLTSPPTRQNDLLFGLMFWALLALAAWLYWPGLYSNFLLDDHPNLERLSSLGKTDNLFFEALRFSLDGIASELGRPISLFSFALQAYDWPQSPFAFKYVNLMLHLLNASLVFWLLVRVGRLQTTLEPRRALLLAWLVTAIWLLHPFQVSTVLYAVQRMVLLAGFFVLLGLLLYVQGRDNFVRGKPLWGYLSASAGVGLGIVFATLSKENGYLLVFFVAVLNLTLLREVYTPRGWRVWQWIFVFTPILLLCAYMIMSFEQFDAAYVGRDFTMSERLLTEARVLLDYLSKIIYPLPSSFGLFHDDFEASRGWLSPPTTLLSVLVWIGLIVTAFAKHRSWPWFAFAVLWFCAGHLLESTFIGLMLYFEHRNYLPLLGPGVLLVYGFFWAWPRLHNTRLLHALLPVIGVLWLMGTVFVAWGEIKLWSRPVQQAMFWAEQHPYSRYAQSHAAVIFNNLGRYDEAQKYYRHMTKAFPKTPGPHILWMGLGCEDAKWMPPLDEVFQRAREASESDTAVVSGMDFLVEIVLTGKCPALRQEDLDALFTLLRENTKMKTNRAQLTHRHAIFHARAKRFERALEILRPRSRTHDMEIRRDYLIWLAMAGLFDEARAYLAATRKILNPREAYIHRKFLDNTEKAIDTLEQLTQGRPPATPENLP